MTILHTRIDSEAEQYLIEHSQHENVDIQSVFTSAYEFDEPYMQISTLQATSLQFMISAFGIKQVLEIGTFVGFSSFAMAKILPSTRSKLTTIEINSEFHKRAEKNQLEYLQACRQQDCAPPGAIEKINFVRDDAKNYLKNLSDEQSRKLDLLFLDGDKENYVYYLEWAIEKLKPGAYFVVDNALFKGGVVNNSGKLSGQIRDLTEKLKMSNSFDYFFLPVGDCMIVAKKK